MILVDVEIKATNRNYDFKLDENAYIYTLIDQIGSIILPVMEKGYEEKMRDMLLCDSEHLRILDLDRTLSDYGIGSGCHLILI